MKPEGDGAIMVDNYVGQTGINRRASINKPRWSGLESLRSRVSGESLVGMLTPTKKLIGSRVGSPEPGKRRRSPRRNCLPF